MRMLNIPDNQPQVFKEDPYIKSMLADIMNKSKKQRINKRAGDSNGPASAMRLVNVEAAKTPFVPVDPSKHFYAIDRPMGHTSPLTKRNQHQAHIIGNSKRLFVESPTSVPLKRIDVDPHTRDGMYDAVDRTAPAFIDIARQVDRKMKPLKKANDQTKDKRSDMIMNKVLHEIKEKNEMINNEHNMNPFLMQQRNATRNPALKLYDPEPDFEDLNEISDQIQLAKGERDLQNFKMFKESVKMTQKGVRKLLTETKASSTLGLLLELADD